MMRRYQPILWLQSVTGMTLPGDGDGSSTAALELDAAFESVDWYNTSDEREALELVEYYVDTGRQLMAWCCAVVLIEWIRVQDEDKQAEVDVAEYEEFCAAHAAWAI